jgi:hypothetical protein
VQWFETDRGNTEENKKAQRALAVLRLLGLFDRPASADCLAELFRAPDIPNLTEALVGKNEAQRNMTYTRLEAAKLLTVNRNASGTLLSLDTHPLLREYFAKQLREQHPGSWRNAHRRLYKHLIASTNEGKQPTLEDLQPLYQAVAHGCLAGMQNEACGNVYHARILRQNEFYSAKKLGAFGSDLGAIACFFEPPWSHVSPVLTKGYQAWLLNEAATRLRALCRLTEAIEPMRVSGEIDVKDEQWEGASISYNNLSELALLLGEMIGAVGEAEHCVTYADRSGKVFQMTGSRAAHADSLHSAGRRAEAWAIFSEAEKMQAERQPNFPLLYSISGFRYCDLLLAASERAAWQLTCNDGLRSPEMVIAHKATLQSISKRAKKTLLWAEQNNSSHLDIVLGYYSLGRAALYASILENSALNISHSELDKTVDGLRRAGQQQYLPLGLLTRAWLRTLEGNRTGSESAKADLDEAWEIAERGSMPLFMADIHLHRARLFFRITPYPWNNPDGTPRSAKDDLSDARRLIEKHGYWRRKEELEDAERVIGK